jgi:hypothetical protein
MGTYHVIKVLTENNPQINVILLGYSFHNLSKSEEDQFNLEDFSKFFFPRYLCILDPFTMLKTSTDYFQNFIRTVPFILRNLLVPVISPSLSSFPFVGQYYRSHNQNCNDSTINRAINRHFINQSIPNGISVVQQKYLKAIVDYCASRNIKLYLVNMPVNIEYEKKIPESFKKEYYAFYEQIRDRAFMVDLHDLKLSQICYGDGDHLNEKGAAIISSKMDSLFRVYQGNLTYFNKEERFSQAN